MSSAPVRHDVEARVRELSPWCHNIDLYGVRTAPDHFRGACPGVRWRSFAHALSADLRGKTVGCHAGFHSMEMKRRGADRVRRHAVLHQAQLRRRLQELVDPERVRCRRRDLPPGARAARPTGGRHR